MKLYGDIIYSNRLLLRKVAEEDLPLLAAWSESKEAHGAYLTPSPYSLSDLKTQLDNGTLWSPKGKTFLIEQRYTGTPLGLIHYWQKEGLDCHLAIAVKIALPGERGKGYGTEAQKFLIMYLFDHVGARIIDMHTDIGNHPQQRCLAKLGFTTRKAVDYQDHHVLRTGFLFRLSREAYKDCPIYRYHYE